jgi:hypothetical protein
MGWSGRAPAVPAQDRLAGGRQDKNALYPVRVSSGELVASNNHSDVGYSPFSTKSVRRCSCSNVPEAAIVASAYEPCGVAFLPIGQSFGEGTP